MKLFLPKLMKCTIIWCGLIFAGLQMLMAQQAGGGQSLDKPLQQVFKTVDGKAIVKNSQEQPATRSASQAATQAEDDLQSYLDKLAKVQTKATSAQTEIDLSKYTAWDRKEPLRVYGGVNVKFINGTLNRNAALTGDAVLVVGDASTAEWGQDAILKGGGFATGHELVRVESEGFFLLSTGTIRDAFCSSTQTFDNAIVLKAGTTFRMTGGTLYNTGGVDNQDKGELLILGGKIVGGGILAVSDFALSGPADVSKAYVNLYNGARVVVQTSLQNSVDCVIPDSKEGLVVATGTTVFQLTQADLGKFIYSDPKQVQTKEWEYALKGTDIVLKEKGGINDEDDLQKYLDDLADKGTAEKPVDVEIPDKGITITKPLDFPDNGYFHITGGTITITGPGGCIHVGGGHIWIDIIIICKGPGCDKGIIVDGGGTVTIGKGGGSSGGKLDFTGCGHGIHIGNGGTVNMYDGTISGCEWGVYNDGGTFNLFGGTISGNTNGGIYNGTGGSILKIHGGKVSGNTHYDIYSLTCFWLSGSCETYGIWLGKGACIYVTSGIKYKWEIHFIDGVETGKPIIIGDGYGLKEGDITIIVIYPPAGWGWHWDGQCGCVQVSEGESGVIDTPEKLRDAIDKATGTCSGQPTVIEITGTIEIDHDLFIKDKSIKLTGGTLTRNLNNREYFIQVQNGCLTLERITIDGRKSSFMEGTMYSPIQLTELSKLTINEGTVIKNHYVNNGDMGLILAQESEVVMNGGSIYNNEVTSSYIVTTYREKSSFTMNGGSVYENKSIGIIYGTGINLNSGVFKNNSSNSVWFNDYGRVGEKGFEFAGKPTFNIYSSGTLSSQVILFGEANLGGSCDIHLNDNKTLINIYGSLQSELLISHSDYIYPAENEPTIGTVIAKGYDGYKLTESDLAKFSYKDNKWGLTLDKAKNTIVLGEAGDDMIRTGDDLQDYLDRLAREGKMGTEEKPEKIDKFVNPVIFNKPVNIPPDMAVKFVEGEFVLHCYDCGIMTIPENGIVYLDGTTVKDDQNNGHGGISTIGKLVMEDNSLVDYIDALPGGKLVLDGGAIGMIGKTIDCINIDEGAEVDLKKGEITGHVKTVSDISLSGDVKIGGTICLLPRNEIRLYSPLRSDLKIGYESIDATPGTVVVSGTGGYQLTQNDLFYLTPVDSKYKFELNGGKIVVADPTTANDEITANQVSAYASDGKIILAGLTPGEEYAIYGIDGHRVYKGKADGSTVSYSIKSNGVYFVRYQNTTIKVASAK